LKLRLIALALCLSYPVDVRAQGAVSVRAGLGGGVTRQGVIEASLQVPVFSRIRGAADLGVLTAIVPCADAWPASLQCGYSGWLAAGGVAIAAVARDDVYLDGLASAGVFRRTSYGDADFGIAGIGVEFGSRLSGALWFTLSARNAWIRDPMYRELFGSYPRLHAFTGGIRITF
jgi:hypothetical protein